jgi:hypothetical protein
MRTSTRKERQADRERTLNRREVRQFKYGEDAR